jgi:peptidoglycan/LPS O-acetylase OafA/YrhL/peroxiredoxin
VSTVAPATGAPAKRPARFSELDALRGLAAVGILILHAYQYSRTFEGYAYRDDYVVRNLIINLDFGLGVFFALSGFVVFLPFAKALVNGRPHMGVREFATRRVFRILPLYFVAILVVWNARYYGGPGQIADLVRHLTFTQIYHNAKIFYTIGPSWSLAVEIHFYVFTGLLVWVLTKIVRRVSSRRKRIIVVAAVPAALAIASLAFKWWAFYIKGYTLDNQPPPHVFTVYYSAIARADGFAFGMLLAVWFAVIGSWRPKSPTLPRVLTIAALVPFAAMVAVRGDRITDPDFVTLFYYAWVGAGTVLIMCAIVISKPEWPTMRLLRARPLQFMGLVSYSLYLWHEPLMLSLQKHHVLYFKDPVAWPLSVAALITIGLFVAWLSYHLIEVPGQSLRRLLQIHRPRSAKHIWRSGELEVRRGTELSTLPSLRGEDGSVVDLGALFPRERPLVAFLHPGNLDEGGLRTGCVTEARAFAESAFVFDALGVDVVGVSSQPPEAQRAFSEREQLPFPMLSDAGGDFSAAAGVPLWHDDGGGVFPERVTLIIDRFGAIQEALSADVAPVARPSVAAARIETLLGARPPFHVTHAQPTES